MTLTDSNCMVVTLKDTLVVAQKEKTHDYIQNVAYDYYLQVCVDLLQADIDQLEIGQQNEDGGLGDHKL